MTSSVPARPRYVPKGGHLVDFSERVTPKLRRLLEKEAKSKGREGSTSARSEGEALVAVRPPTREDKETSGCMEIVVWSAGTRVGTDVEKENRPSPTSTAASTTSVAICGPQPSPPLPSSALPRSSWKPPGCLRQPLWRRPKNSKPKNTNGRKTAAAASTPTTEHREQSTSEVSMPTATLVESKEHISLHQQQQALHAKTIRIESLAAKCSREMKEFEAYKEEELRRLAEMKDAFRAKKKRDALAMTAEARASSQHAELARLRLKVEELEGALEAQRAKHKGDKEKWAVDVQRYRDEISELKEEVRGFTERAMGGRELEGGGKAGSIVSTESIETPSTPGYSGNDVQMHRHANSTVEKRWKDGTGRVQYLYENGDIRQSDGSGVVEYLYAGVDCWNTSYADGDHVYYFKDGRRECHGADGTVQILADGRCWGCCNDDPGRTSGTAVRIPVDKINPKLLRACPIKF